MSKTRLRNVTVGESRNSRMRVLHYRSILMCDNYYTLFCEHPSFWLGALLLTNI